MTAGVLARHAASSSGLRPIDPRRDMAQVADLIEVSFRGDLDPMGRRMVREMRALGRAGWIGWAVSQVLLPPVARPQGFVWEEAGQVVGNASLLPVRGFSDRWVLANVAVSPEYRRRGIGRQMVKAAIAHARRSGGESLYLQVERENDPALLLYAALGFQAVTTRTTWRRQVGMLPEPVSPPAPPATRAVGGYILSGAEGNAVEGYIPSAVEGQLEIRPRKRGEWTRQWELALQAFPDGLVWPYPLDPDIFRGSRVSSRQDWLAWNGGRPVGSLTTRQGASMRMILLATAESQGEIERELVSYGLSKIRLRKTAIVIDYLADLAVRELKELGFREERTLTWMSRRLKE